MLELGEQYSSERGSWIRITDRTEGRLSFERQFAPRTGRADPHYHLDLAQTWEVLSGVGKIEVDGLQKATLPLIAAIGRLRGFRAKYD